MNFSQLDVRWMWHPEWTEECQNSAGAFVYFRKQIMLDAVPMEPILLNLSADTRYKLYINAQLVCYGPVRGDEHLWFYDEVNIQPYLKTGVNHIVVRVLRLYYATQYGTSFSRLPVPGLFVHCDKLDEDWDAALDKSTQLPIDQAEDDFLHIYENVNHSHELMWVPVKYYSFPVTHGLSPPWKLSPRMIPFPKLDPAHFKAVHNVRSSLPSHFWEKILIGSPVRIPAGLHHLELEANEHLTAFLKLHFEKPTATGSTLKVTYSECYEDAPTQTPYLRRKGNRCDTKKFLFGPRDSYVFSGQSSVHTKCHDPDEGEAFAPFHFRTLRFMTLDIQVVEGSELVLQKIDMVSTNYPLDVQTEIPVSNPYRQIWDASVRTLRNCMHDCYEDCPFYEQLQYAMDTRSSILFTYCISGDDRLARQAIVQLHNSYQPSIGLTASRGPAHQLQIIPHFSLFWILMVADHFEYFGDTDFVCQFGSACDGVLEHFARRIDTNGLIRPSDHWDFVDWADAWRPMGIPPAATRTGFSTFTSMLYVHALKRAAEFMRPALAAEYQARAEMMKKAIRQLCFDGQYFTDGLASAAGTGDHSQLIQVWAVLCGVTNGDEASLLLSNALSSDLTPASVASSFYTLRALSMTGNYDSHFHTFWEPWRSQLADNLLTWEEDTVSQRSDCHAWGCAALYEFPAEVGGIRPAKNGAGITFQPRLALFPDLDMKIPFGGSIPGVAHVKWSRLKHGDVRCSLALQMKGAGDSRPSVVMVLPNCAPEEVTDTSGEITRVIKMTDML